MSRTTRKFPGDLNPDDFDDQGLFIIRGHYNMSKQLRGIDECWTPPAKKLRKKLLSRKQRHQGKDFSEWSL